MIKFDFIKWSLLFKLASFSGYIIEKSHYRNKSIVSYLKNKKHGFSNSYYLNGKMIEKKL
jgi:hypothetical protein